MVVHEVFEVLYSPVKAFKKIIEKPDFKGVLLILVLFMSFTVVEQYIVASKLLVQTRTPDDDNWTESTALWTSNVSLSIDGSDYKVGNYSVKSSVSNGTNIWMKITGIGTLDCSEDKGYEELFFWINWTHENGVPSSNATLRLFSVNESYFERSLTNFISNSSAEWSNATLKIGPNQGWTRIDSPDWKSVTGLEFRLAWLTSANLTMKIDDLRFQRYVSVLEKGAFSVEEIIQILMSAAVVFSLNWILWALILLMIAKVFREGGVPGTVFSVIIGHVFIVTVVYTIASAVLFSMLPVLNLPLKAPPATEEEINTTTALVEERWHPNWAYWGYLLLSGLYLPFVREVWILALCVTAIRLLHGITWGKAASISIVAFIIRSTLRFFFGI